MKLIDTNVLLYATDRLSPFHDRSRDFVERAMNSDEVIALPWVVLLAFLRILTRARPEAPLPRDVVIAMVDTWLAQPNVVTLGPGKEHWRVVQELIAATQASGNLMTDVHLAALAIENGAELCSADTDFARFPRLKWTDPTR